MASNGNQPVPDSNYPQQYGPQFPAPEPKKKNFFARHKVLTALGGAAVFVIVIAALSSGGSPESDTAQSGVSATTDSAGHETSGTPDSADPVTEPAEAAPVKIGAPAVDGKFEFTVTKVEPGVAEVGNEYLNKQAQGQFVLVHMTVKNTGTKAESFTSGNQYLYDQHGNKASADAEAAVYLEDSNSLYTEINPGNTASGIVVFDIPKDAVPTTVELHESMLSQGVKVSAS